ncbi:hypothetical protein [Pantoea cypripedii]|uniref:Uncharacterized protein n=1 Tax=Pantoea cypripedii TaxID=55209 RepID=A0A6B9FXI9_PANCY|nr:hypothetical protein [Pantoea cypripedii]QGY29161.1 hypothetical protein CUN67_09560 [Pantoea cypripedii]
MQGAAPVSTPATGRAVPESAPLSTFPLSRFCRSLRNSLAHLYSNHRLPRSPSEALRQSLSNASGYLSILTRSSPSGIETPPLAAAQLVTRWIFSLLQQQAIHQADAQRLQLLTVTSAYPAVNAFIYRLNTFALSATSPQLATCALRRIDTFVASQHTWLASLPLQEQQVCREFMHKLTACLENMAFWQPRATLLLPAVCRLAPYFSVWAGVALPQLASSASSPHTRQLLSASILTEDNTGPDAEQWFTPDRTVINLPGDVTLPTLHLSKGQSRCLRLPKCPAELVSHTGNLTTGFDIAGVGIEHNLATEVCISNYGVPEIEINRQLNAATTAYPSRLYRVPLRIAGAGDDGVCPASRAAIPVTFSHQPDLLPAPVLAGEPLRAASADWNFLPMVGAQYSAGDANSAREQNSFLSPFFDWEDFYLPDEVEETSPPAETLSASLSPAEQIDHEVNLFERDKRILFAFRFPPRSPSTTDSRGLTTSVPATTPDSMTRLFGRTDEVSAAGSCRVPYIPLVARDLNEMFEKIDHWLRQMTPKQIDNVIHVFFTRMTGDTHSQLPLLDKIVTVARKLVMKNRQQYAFDDNESFQFAAQLFKHSYFSSNKELLKAWVKSGEGKQQLADILLNAIDRAIPDSGKLLSETFNILTQIVKPEFTSFSSLANIQIDLQNRFKNNLIATITMPNTTPPRFLENETAIEKLQFLHLEFIKNNLPCFRLSNKLDVSDEIVLSKNGMLLTIAAGIICDDNKLINLAKNKLIQFGTQALLRLSENYLLTKFSFFNHLLDTGKFRMFDFINRLEAEGGLLVRTLYFNHIIHQKLQQGGIQASQLKSDYQALADVSKKLCNLALEDISDIDQDFFLNASREPAGLEVCFITAENTSDAVKKRHFIGFTLAAHSERIRRCYTVSEIPALNNFVALLAYNDSENYRNKEQYTSWINYRGKADFIARLSGQNIGLMSQSTFFVSDKITVPAASAGESWKSYIQNLSQSIVSQRFPEMNTTSTVSSSTSLNTLINFTGNLISQFIPIESCKQALNDVLEKPDTATKVLLTLEDAMLCLYDLSPEGESSKLVKSLAYVARSVIGKITEKIREETKRTSAQFNAEPGNIPVLQEQIYLEDSQIKHVLANSSLFSADFNWMLHNNSLNLRQLPPQIKFLNVVWNMITDQIYCKANTTQGVRNYRVDQENLTLLPSDHEIPDHELHTQDLALNVNSFLTQIKNGTLDALKIARLEEDMTVVDKYGYVYFKKEFNEINFARANITDLFFNNLIAPAGWKPVNLWVKNDDGDMIITEWRDNHGHSQFQQLSKFSDFFRSWTGEPHNNNERSQRIKRDVSTPAPDYTDIISPMTYGYRIVNPYEDYQRIAAMKELITEGSKLPDPPHFAEIECRKMMQDLERNLPFGVLEQKFPAAREFIRKFAQWDIPAVINAGFKKFTKAIELFHQIYPEENTFYPKAVLLIEKLEALDRKITAFRYRNQAWRDKVAIYYDRYPAREIKVNSRINKILDSLSSPSPGSRDTAKYILKTRTTQDMVRNYPEFYARLTDNLKELQAQARMTSNLFNNRLYRNVMGDTLYEFTGVKFSQDEIASFTSDFRRMQNHIIATTPDKFRIFEERFSRDGKLVSGCFKDDAEKILFSTGDLAFTNLNDNHKYIYVQKILNDDLFKQIAAHEIDHVNNGLDLAYTPPEVYIESYNLIKKFSFSGIQQIGKELLSDRGHLVDYLMRDKDFLSNFCEQLIRYAKDPVHRVKIGDFQHNYLGKNAVHYRNRYSDEAIAKRSELKNLVAIAYNDHPFLLYFFKQNADFMISLWHRLAGIANKYFNQDRTISEEETAKFELLKSLVLKAGAAMLDEVNAGASTSNAGQGSQR